MLPATAAAQRDGNLGAGQVAVIRKFYHHLPGWIGMPTREQVEARLAKNGTRFRPEQLAGLAGTLADCLNPDGAFTYEDRCCTPLKAADPSGLAAGSWCAPRS